MSETKPPPVKLAFSHVGIHCLDLSRMVDFYTRALGFTETDRGVVRGLDIVFTTWDPADHHQVALVSGRPDIAGFNHINQLSFRVPKLEDVQAVWGRVKDEPGVHDMRGTNHGNAFAFYFRDPEGNRIEVFCDTPWYISQPCIELLDLSRPAAEVMAEAEAFCRSAPGFKPITEYQAEVARKIARNVADLSG
jgi:catechol 2,3-dioxygenase-like lactoylglutathione lyase family enzyme